jgi:hypothetical protein
MDARIGVIIFLVVWTILLLAIAWMIAPALIGISVPAFKNAKNNLKLLYYVASQWSFKLRGVIPQ